MKKIEGGITAAKGFQAAGGAAGIKKQGVKDMALVYSEVPCVAAGTFTTNIVKAAPVKWDQEIVYNHPTAQAIVCNSGIANACTGEEGYGYCRKTAEAASAALSIPEDSVLVVKSLRFFDVASRPNFLGKIKFLAYPSFTFTISPFFPRDLTSSNNITFIKILLPLSSSQ